MNFNDKYSLWLGNAPENIRKIISNYNDHEIEKYFSEDLSFGTAGIRSIMGYGSSLFNEYVVAYSTFGFGKFLLKKYSNEKVKVVVGTDNRNNNILYMNKAIQVLTSMGIEVIFKSTIPTPFISFVTRETKAHGAINITASHNSKEYNGFKVYDSNGCQLLPEDANQVSIFSNEIKTRIFQENFVGNINLSHEVSEELENKYLKKIVQMGITSKTNAKIVFSPLHGTTNNMIPKIAKELNFNLINVENQMNSDGNFSNTESPNPESPLAYIESTKVAKKEDANHIIITDPDGDRIGVSVRENGEYRILSGNEVAILILNNLIEEKKHSEDSYICYSTVSSVLPRIIAEKNDIKVFETLTGFKWIGDIIDKNNSENFLFGFEESYGSLVNSELARDKDAIQGATAILSIIEKCEQQNMTLIDKLNDIQKDFLFFKDKTQTISFDSSNPKDDQDKFMDKIRNLREIDGAKIIDYLEDDKLKSNLIKIVWPNRSWIAIRPSGTEPKIKFYISAISNDKEKLQPQIDKMNDIVKTFL